MKWTWINHAFATFGFGIAAMAFMVIGVNINGQYIPTYATAIGSIVGTFLNVKYGEKMPEQKAEEVRDIRAGRRRK